MIQPGDIIFVKGDTPIISPIIRWFTSSEYTHVGLAVSSDLIYEIDINKKMAIHPMKHKNYDVFRYKHGLTESHKTQMQQYAIQKAKENQGYDWWRIIGFGIEKFFLTRYIFDRVNYEVCSEIADMIYHKIGIDLVPDRDTGNVTPAHLSHSPELIKVFSSKA